MSSITASTIRSATVGALATQNSFRKCDAVLVEADRGDGEEDGERQDRGDGDVRGRGEARRDQRQHVGEEDEQEERHDVGEVLRALLAGDVLDHLVDEAVDRLGDRLRRAIGTSARPREPPIIRTLTPMTASAIQSVALVGVYQCTSVAAEERVDLELVHRVDVEAAAAVFRLFARSIAPLSSGSGGPASCRASVRPRRGRAAPLRRCGAWCARRRRSRAARTPPETPAGCRRARPARSRSRGRAACPPPARSPSARRASLG